MEQPPPLKIVQVCSIEPQHETTPSLQIPTSLPLTFFDIFWLRFPPVERLFFYELQNSTTISFYDSILPNLKKSLSLTLQHFLPFAGNIIWPLDSSKPIINYVKGDYVSFNVAESNTSFNLLCSDLCEATQRNHLIPHLKTSHEQAPLIAIQVTLFPNTGFCIGITTHHAALDGKSSTCFMKSWAYTCSNLEKSQPLSSLPENLTPLFDRSVIKDPTGISQVFADAWLKHGGEKSENNRSLKVWDSYSTLQTDAVKGLFELTPSHIQKLKKYANSKLKEKVKLSTFSVTCAYVFACLVKAEQPKFERVVFIFAVDCRDRLDPPISPMYLGNCIAGQRVVFETKDLVEKDGFICALEGVNGALNRVKNGVLDGAENWISDMFSGTENKIYSIAGSPRFEVYSVDFGWGRPKKVDITSIDKTGAFSLSESRNNNGGIEIGLVLNKPQMDDFVVLFVQGLESF